MFARMFGGGAKPPQAPPLIPPMNVIKKPRKLQKIEEPVCILLNYSEIVNQIKQLALFNL